MKVRPSILLTPARDTWRGLDRCLEGGWRALAWLGAGLLAGWWLYVPAHELLHAAACRATGGEVRKLEIAPLYGGAFLARLLPFVTAGGDYAGRLSGFDTHGSDAVYLATDFGPYLLTLFPGVWWLRRAARAAPRYRAFSFGAALPVALAPFLSLGGDAYEIGAIAITRLAPWSGTAARQILRGDDLTLRVSAIQAAAGNGGGGTSTGAGGLAMGSGAAMLWSGLTLAALTGLVWALAFYGAGALVAGWAGEPALKR
jgi:hypothetical protein